ncbi:MAG: fimbria/pilus outer membrane usher protein [Pseudomonadales bacterium]
MERSYPARAFTSQLFVTLRLAPRFLLLVSLWGALNVNAGTLNPSNRTLELHTTLRHANSIIATVLLSVSAQDELSLSADGVLSLLAPLIEADALRKIRSRANSGRLALADFNIEGISLHFDRSALELVLHIPPSLELDKAVSLHRDSDNRRYVKPANISGYINLRLGLTSQKTNGVESSERTFSQSHSVEAAVRALSSVVELEGRFEKPDTSSRSRFYRQGSRVSYDFAASSTRVTGGDLFTFGSHFQDSADILGLGVSRDFDLIPTRNVRPSAGRRFRLQRPSDVDVFVDGVLVRKLHLAAGSFNLQDIPLVAGSNNIELLIEDASGASERINFNVATAQDLLASGEFDYSIAAGVVATPSASGPDYQSDSEIATATARYGVAPWLTLGINAQGTQDTRQWGGSALLATDLGRFNLALSRSRIAQRGKGHALSLGFDANFGRSNPRNKSLTLHTELLSSQFGGVGAVTDTTAPSGEPLNTSAVLFNAAYSQRFSNNLRGSIGLGYNRMRAPRHELYTLRAGLSGNIGKSAASWNLSVGMQHSQRDGRDDVALLSLSWPLDAHSKIRSDSSAPDVSQELSYHYSRHPGRIGGVRSKLAVRSDPNSDAQISGGLEYTANRFIATLDHDTKLTHLNGRERSHSTRVRVETALAMADGHFAIGRPVSNSFAIVHPHRSLSNNRIVIDQTPQSVLNTSDGLGNVLISDLGSYRGRTINYDVHELPLGYDLGEGAFSVNPPHRAGYSLQVGSDATVTVMGTLIDATTGEPMGLTAGHARYQNDPDVPAIAFFSNRKGRFAITGMKPGDYILELATQPVRTHRVVIGANANALLRLAEIEVK